jgi:peroxiredoxin
MPTRTQPFVAVLALAAAAVMGCGDVEDRMDLSQPGALTSFQVRDLDGAPVSMASSRGKVVVLNVWAVWCAPCRQELPALDRLARDVDPRRVAVVGIATDDDTLAVREFVRQANLSFPIWLDPGRILTASALPGRAIPETYLIGPDGRVRERFRGRVDFDAPAWRARLARAQESL